jgi:predicted lactoylglutathione lyase
MSTKVFINLPVKDLTRSMAFFQGLGYSFNPQFTDEKAGCMVVSENIFVMLLSDPYFRTFIDTEVCDAHRMTEVLIALEANTKEEVVELVGKAVELGGRLYAKAQDHGWMYQHSFADPDGHKWEVIFMDATQLPNHE